TSVVHILAEETRQTFKVITHAQVQREATSDRPVVLCESAEVLHSEKGGGGLGNLPERIGPVGGEIREAAVEEKAARAIGHGGIQVHAVERGSGLEEMLSNGVRVGIGSLIVCFLARAVAIVRPAEIHQARDLHAGTGGIVGTQHDSSVCEL